MKCFPNPRKWRIVGSCFLLMLLIINVSVVGQQPPKKKQSKAANEAEVDLARWKYLLDSLATEARSLSPEKRRPYALGEVADAYWNLDRETARTLFTAALDSTLAVKDGERIDEAALNFILAKAAKRDIALAKTLTERSVEKQKLVGTDEWSISVALNLLKRDPGSAARLAEAFVPSGLSNGDAAFFILELAKKDINSANQVYSAYLNNFATNNKLPLQHLLSLSGYAFGYCESYSLSGENPPNLFGLSCKRIPGLAASPALVRTFLNLAFQRTQNVVERIAQTSGAERDYLSVTALFTVAYLLPEVAKHAPNTVSAWERLRQQATTGTTALQHEQVARHLQSINENRAAVRRYDDVPELTPIQEADATLEKADKLPQSCQRDSAYSKAALTIASTKDFKRALSVADRISDLKQSESVKQFISYRMSTVAAEAGDLEEAQAKAMRVSAPEQRAILLIKIAQAAITHNDRSLALRMLQDVVQLAGKISDPETQASVLLGTASVLLKVDPLAAQDTVSVAIKAVNRETPKDESRFSLVMKIPLSCNGEDSSWYGDSVSLPNSHPFETLVLLSKHDTEASLLMAQNLEDPSAKIRAMASIVRSVVDRQAKPNNKTATSYPTPNNSNEPNAR